MANLAGVFESQSPSAISVIRAVIDDLAAALPRNDGEVGDGGAVDSVIDFASGVEQRDRSGDGRSEEGDEEESENDN